MASAYQHCPTCEEEYVAGVAACAECGGPLQPGPLERLTAGGSRRGEASAAPAGTGRPDRLLGRLPGLQADHAVRALLLEGIACGVECHGVEKFYVPGQEPAEPFAVSMPVSVYVADAQYDAAQEIIASFEAGDVIGEQWAEPANEDADAARDLESMDAPHVSVSETEDLQSVEGPVAESTSLRTVVLIVIAAIVLLFLFGR